MAAAHMPRAEDGPQRATVVTTVRGQANARDGRLGHEAKNIISGMLLATINNWTYLPPPSTGAFGFKEVDDVIDLQRLQLRPASAWSSAPGLCPPAWPSVVLNDTGFAGIESFEAWQHYLRSRVPTEPSRLCVRTCNGFRLHLHHAHAWERRGLVPKGSYTLVTRALRRAFRNDRAARGGDESGRSTRDGRSTSMRARSHDRGVSNGGLAEGQRGSIAIHVRRGDKLSRGATSRYPLSLIRGFVSLASTALLETRIFSAGVNVRIYTEPGNSSELFAAGCPPFSNPLIACEVTSGSVLSDLRALVNADVAGLSSSSFSVLAYYLRHEHQPALTPVRTIAQFFSAVDGSDGRSLNTSRHRMAARAPELGVEQRARERTPPPHNIFFLQQVLQQHATATAIGSATARAASLSTDLRALLLTRRSVAS